MGEQHFRIEVGGSCIRWDATGVMVKGEDGGWRYWIEYAGRVHAGSGVFPPTRVGHGQLKARAAEQFEALLGRPRPAGVADDVQ